MTTHETKTSESSGPARSNGKLAIGLAIGFLAVVVLWVARNQVVRPLDTLATEFSCRSYGEERDLHLESFERSNRFGLLNRSAGYCAFVPFPVDEGDDGAQAEQGEPVTITLADTDMGLLYDSMKIMGIIVQFGIVSIVVRLLVDPAMMAYEIVRQLSARRG